MCLPQVVRCIILMKCNSVVSLEFMRTQYEPNMPETHRKYLNSVPAQQQFPASRCAMGDERMRIISLLGE